MHLKERASNCRAWCLVLGASSGIGRACAQALARAGMNVFGVHLDPAERSDDIKGLEDTIRGCGVRAQFFNENAASDGARRRVLKEIREMAGPGSVQVFVHSLAFGALLPYVPRDPQHECLSRTQMDMTLNVMANSLVYWTQDLISEDLLHQGAKVFALTSAGSARASASYGAVSAAKCALESHVRQLAVELAPRGIAANALRAGVTISPSLLRIPEHDEIIARARRYNPHGRLTTPEDVGAAVVGLAHLPSSWMTGNVIGVDGGEFLTA